MILYVIHVNYKSTRVRRCTTQFVDMQIAIRKGNLENAKWIASKNDEWEWEGPRHLRMAARGGHLKCLKWLFHELGYSSVDERKVCLAFMSVKDCKRPECLFLHDTSQDVPGGLRNYFRKRFGAAKGKAKQ